MYTRAKSLPNLYIRNIIPDDMGIPLLEYLVISGRPHAYFGDARLLIIMLRDMNFASWAFSEVRLTEMLGSQIRPLLC